MLVWLYIFLQRKYFFFFWIFLLHLSPSLLCQACCFCFVSHRRSEVINYSKGRKHLGGLCYMNNKCSCPQALVQVVNKLVNYIEINAIALDLKLHSPCIGSVFPVLARAFHTLRQRQLLHRPPPRRSSVRARPSPGVGFKLYPLPQPSSQRLRHKDLGQP